MEQEPQPLDFRTPEFAGLVELLMAKGHISREEAIEALNQRWVEGRGRAPPVGEDNAVADPPQGQPPMTTTPQQLCTSSQRPSTPAGGSTPSSHGYSPPGPPAEMLDDPVDDPAIMFNLTVLETFKYIPMWYFTREGLHEGARTVHWSDENETLAIMQAHEGNITVQAANSLTASKNAKLDHQLSYAEYMFAKNYFLVAIENAKWGNKAVDAFNWFFHNLDNHPLWEEGLQGE
ncbi:hypothetical protein ID866_8549 [Astraeus odoratus]|nr:hypothetical protein ID866_8549 [Astraeus odoratus]